MVPCTWDLSGPSARATCLGWCFTVETIRAETLLPSALNSGRLLPLEGKLFGSIHFCPFLFIIPLWVWNLGVNFVAGFKPRASTYLPWCPSWASLLTGYGWVNSLGWISLPCESFRLQISTGPVLIWFCLVCLLCTASVMLSFLVPASLSLHGAYGAMWCPHTWELPLPPHCNFAMTAHSFTSFTCRGGGRRDCASVWERAALDAEGTAGSGDGEY